MTEFIINTPYHKRWILPDGKHYYNSVLYGDFFHDTIWKQGRIGELDELILSLPSVKIDDAGKWKETLELAQALAERKFRKPASKAQQLQQAHNFRR